MPDAITEATLASALSATKKARKAAGLASGPEYRGQRPAPLVWFDQIFEAGATPSSAVACSQPLRVGGTQNQLDLVIVASHSNAGNLSVPAAGTIAIACATSDAEDGTFTSEGPTITATIPTGGYTVAPDGLVLRVALGNFSKPWLKPTVTFTGSFTGGKVDIALAFMPK